MSSYPWMNVPFEKDPTNFSGNSALQRHAAHALLYCACSDKNLLFGTIEMEYAIMMQLRHDGMIGFPGGYVDEKEESIVAGLNRELHEEIGLSSKCYFNEDNFFGAWKHSREIGALVDHFYIKEFAETDFWKIEQAAISSRDWGTETLGLIRVPVYDCNALRRFFNHSFVGNARDQLVRFLIEKKIFADYQIDRIWSMAETEKK